MSNKETTIENIQITDPLTDAVDNVIQTICKQISEQIESKIKKIEIESKIKKLEYVANLSQYFQGKIDGFKASATIAKESNDISIEIENSLNQLIKVVQEQIIAKPTSTEEK